MLPVVLALTLSSAPPLVTAEGVTLEPDGREPFRAPLIGLQLDAGFPDGLGASLVVTPIRFLRVHAGGLNNGAGSGVRFGAMLLAFPSWAFRPFLGADGGYVFAGVGAWLVPMLSDPTLKTALQTMNVGFVNAHVGFELGSKDVALTLRGGFSYVALDTGSQAIATGASSTVTISGAAVTGVVPSARIGFIFHFD